MFEDIDWTLVGKVVGGGFGITIFVLVILTILTWLMGLVIQKFSANSEK